MLVREAGLEFYVDLTNQCNLFAFHTIPYMICNFYLQFDINRYHPFSAS